MTPLMDRALADSLPATRRHAAPWERGPGLCGPLLPTFCSDGVGAAQAPMCRAITSRPGGWAARLGCSSALALRIVDVVPEDVRDQTRGVLSVLLRAVISQQLAVLRSNNIVLGRKEGVTVRYGVRDPLIGELLDTARQIFNNHLVSTQGLLRELQRERRRR